MEPKTQPNTHDEPASSTPPVPSGSQTPSYGESTELSAPTRADGIRWVFIGGQGLRAGWSIAVFLILFILIGNVIGFLFGMLHLQTRSGHTTVRGAFTSESIAVLSLIGAAWAVALIERRSILDFNLRGTRSTANFLSGTAAGFLALSILVGGLWAGGWLQFGSVALSGTAIAKYALLWGITFLLVGCVEEGMVRCYLQFTLTRSINFWWAIGIQALLCASLILRAKGAAAWGVYAMIALGLVPCLMLQLKRSPSSGFWQAAWVTSTLFGFMHVSNSGENSIGIFAAAAIGFVFCVSIRLTGSAWWAIGCHAGWDWAETYFYGTADSGLVAHGHYLSSNPVGNAFWSGGTNGPEGSVLVLGTILLLLISLIIIYRPEKSALAEPAAQNL